MMNQKTFIILLVLLMITGCLSSTSTPASTLNPTIRVEALTPATRDTPTDKPSINDQCIEPKIDDLDNLKTMGSIVLVDIRYKAYVLDMNTFEKVSLAKEDEFIFSIATSPNQQLTAYELYSRTNDTNKLILMNSFGEVQLTAPWKENWSFISSWLDSQRLMINDYDESSDKVLGSAAKEFSTFLAVDPFTGEQILLRPDFPGVYSHHMMPPWIGFGSTVYSPALDRVVYIRADSVDADFHYVLWNIDEQRSLADFRVLISGRGDIPRWSPDGEKFAIALSPFEDISNKWLVYNLYAVSRDGDVAKLTELSEYYPWHYIGQQSWSPDVRHIAFWFSGWTEPPSYTDLDAAHYLAVVDSENKDLSIYCVSGKPQGNGMVPPPVWSPDGRQIVLESPLTEGHSQVLLLDLERKNIVVLGKDMTPVGWMIAP